jgi:DNA repair protein RecO (recombination protein O)
MTSSRRVDKQPAYVLHHRPFRDSSQLLDVFTRDHGKIALVARGSRGSRSRLAGILRPFVPLQVSWVSRSDLGTLTGAEVTGAPAGLQGDALLSAYYVNELLLHFLHRHDPQPEIHALYAQALAALCAAPDVAPGLRAFELEFLGLLGYAVDLEYEAGTQQALDPESHYEYRLEQGPVPVARDSGPMVFRGDLLSGIRAQRFDDADVLRAAGRLLRAVIAHHLGGKELKSRKVLLDVHRGRIAGSRDRNTGNG